MIFLFDRVFLLASGELQIGLVDRFVFCLFVCLFVFFSPSLLTAIYMISRPTTESLLEEGIQLCSSSYRLSAGRTDSFDKRLVELVDGSIPASSICLMNAERETDRCRERERERERKRFNSSPTP